MQMLNAIQQQHLEDYFDRNMAQIFWEENAFERALDIYQVVHAQIEQDQIQLARKRRRLSQAILDQQAFIAHVENCLSCAEFNSILAKADNLIDAMQPTVTSEDLQFQSILDTVFSPQNPDATQCSSSNQHSIVLDKSLESVPAVSLDTLFFLSNAVSDSTSELPITPTSSPHSIILPYTTNEERWQAVLKHDPEANGHFVYSVKSTGIFCRPTCPSRRPLLSNVSFFLTNDEAEKAGFRPCKRCKPHDLVLPSDLRQLSAVELVKKEIEVATAQGVKQPSLRYLANKAGMSSFHFHRVFKARTGVTLDEYRKLVLAQREESTEYYA